MKRILVTGGAGFIGSNFILMMRKKHPNMTIVNLDALTYAGNLENLADFKSDSRYVFIEGDICDKNLIGRLFADYEFDGVVHFAAESHVDRSISASDIFIKTNVLGTHTLLDAARNAWGPDADKRFVHVSTDEVYGSLGATGLFSEQTPIAPNSPYSASKAGSDLIVRAFFETYHFPVLITRCSNNYGPYQFPEKLIPLMIINAMNNKPLPVYGDGMNVRDWLYVVDHCSAIATVLFKGKPGEVYNIGGNNEFPNIKIVKLILGELDKPESLITYVKDRPGHDRRYAMDASKIMRELGWSPSIEFPEGIRQTIKWYIDHQEWWKKLMK